MKYLIREKLGMVDLEYRIAKIKWRRTGNIAQQNEERWERKIEKWIPRDRRRYRGRPIRRWNDEINSEMGPLWSPLHTIRHCWQTVTKLLFRKKN